MQHRPRIAGLDLFCEAQSRLPLDRRRHGDGGVRRTGRCSLPGPAPHASPSIRFLFSPARYTSLPLAVIEAMTIGMPVVALATTELPTVIENGVNGFISCDLETLISHMKRLIDNPDEAMRIGRNARQTALRRFGLDRFARDWNRVFAQVTGGAPIRHADGHGRCCDEPADASPFSASTPAHWPGSAASIPAGRTSTSTRSAVTLARWAYEVDVFTRRDQPDLPEVVDLSDQCPRHPSRRWSACAPAQGRSLAADAGISRQPARLRPAHRDPV